MMRIRPVEFAEWLKCLDRASRHGPWTRVTLDIIAAKPELRAPEPVGYRLAPRGKTLLFALREVS